MAYEDPMLDHAVPADLLELYEILEYVGEIVPERPSAATRLRALTQPITAAVTATPLPANFVSRASAGLWAPRSVTKLSGTEGNTLHWEGMKMGSFPHESCATKVRGIQRFHMEERGWVDIAYSSVECPHDYVFEGRWYGVRTAANGTNVGNDLSYAHCYLGGSGDPFDLPAKRAIRRVIEYFEARGSGKKRWAHRNWRPTECPGDAQTTWLNQGMPVEGTTPPPPPPPEKVTVNVQLPVLRRGSKGQHVQKLQVLLNVLDAQAKLTPDGDFGPATEAVVKRFQVHFKIPSPPGVVDAHTWQPIIALPL